MKEIDVQQVTYHTIPGRKAIILKWLVFLSLMYLAIYGIIVNIPILRLQPDPKFCKGNETTCSRSDLFAKQIISFFMQMILGTTGFLVWHWTKQAHNGIPATPNGRIFGYLKEAEYLLLVIVVYQVWDFIFSLPIPEHATPIFLVHHLLAGITAWLSLEFQMVHHYAIFFGGCSEISSIFLALCDFDVYFPASRGSLWSTIVFLCQASFALGFVYYRVAGWLWVSIPLWKDVFHVLKSKDSEQLRPGKSWFLFVFLAMNFLLGLLQFYWFGFGILPKILEILEEK